MWTMDKAIREAARFIKSESTLFASGDSYKGAYLTDDAANTLKNELMESINNKIIELATSRRLLWTTEELTTIDVNGLAYNFLAIKSIKDKNGDKVSWTMGEDGIIKCLSRDTDIKTVSYYYVPEVITSVNDEIPIPESRLQPIIFSYWAAFMHYQINRKYDKASYWLSLYTALEEKIHAGDILDNNHVGQGW